MNSCAIFAQSGPARSMFLAVQKRLDRLNTVLQENLAGVRVVKAFVREEQEIERFGSANEELTAQSIRVFRVLALLMPLMMVIMNAAVIVALFVESPPHSVLGKADLVGFAVCHRIPERSFILAGQQLPLCVILMLIC